MFDLHSGVGGQLEGVGVGGGDKRWIKCAMLYAAVVIVGEGINEGNLKGPFDPLYGQHALADEPYRQVLRAVIEANNWNGSIPQAYHCYETLYINNINTVLIQDYGDMSMAIVLYGGTPTLTDFYTKEQTIALFTTDHLNLRPAGVKLYFLMLQEELPLGIGYGGPPAFGIGVDNDNIAGIEAGHMLRTVRVE